MANKEQFQYNRKSKKFISELNKSITNDNLKCGFCNLDNEINNFICSSCGFPLDLNITQNEFGLPEIN
jgi:hypothetical protein